MARIKAKMNTSETTLNKAIIAYHRKKKERICGYLGLKSKNNYDKIKLPHKT